MKHTTFDHEILHFTQRNTDQDPDEHLVSVHIHGQRRWVATDDWRTDYPLLDNGRVFWDNPEYWTDEFRARCAEYILTSNLALIERNYRASQKAGGEASKAD